MSNTATKLTYLNTTKTLIKDNLNLGGANISNEPFRVYSSKLIDIYKDFLANGTDTLWNNWLPKVNGTGESLTLNNTIKAKMKIDLKGNTSQEGTPTPDSPQEIHTVSGDNSIKVEGKNLFDIDNLTVEMGTINVNGQFVASIERVRAYWVEVKENTTYTISTSNSDLQIVPYYYNSSNTFISYDSGWKNFPFTFMTPANTKYVAFLFKNSTNNPKPSSLTEIMLNEGSTATSYVPYEAPATYPINLGSIELCKIGDYQDSIVKDNGKWYLNKQIGKVVLDGSENWNTSEEGTNTYRFSLPQTLLQSQTNGYCKRNKYVKSGVSTDTEVIGIVSGVVYFRISKSLLTALDTTQFKNWLASNNVIIYAPLITPTYEEITDTILINQLEAIKYSYNNQTNISQENNDKPFILDVVALGELEEE